ncbi:NINE protein [Deinococcus sp. SM5_A1]|uniref:TM2 domain-containing protein n=1 Tax=Deinococcus sp. SM5_A1 TaxID=3379094 RepID=UPI00385C8064
MTNPDDQKTPAAGRPQGNGNAPSWVDDVLGSPGGSAQTRTPDSSRPNLSKTPSAGGDLRIPEPARAAPAPAAETDDWISRVTGSPPPARANAPHTAPQPSSPRPTAPDLDAWGEPQRPMPQPTMPIADERPVTPYTPVPTYAGDVAQKRLIAGLLAIFLGSLGVHKFYLGMNTQGIMILGANIGVWILALLIGVVTLGFGLIITLPLAGLVSAALGLLGLVEGILYLTKSDADFGRDYLVGKKPWL